MSEFLTESDLDSRVPAWMRQLEVDGQKKVRLARPALCVLDMQNDFLRGNGALPVWGGPAIIPRVAALLQAFRKAQWPVFFSRHICLDPAHAAEMGVSAHIRYIDGLLREGFEGSAIIDDLRPAQQENVVTKYRYSAFFGTSLELLLRSHGVQEVVITGVVTNVCCETTAHDAFFRDFGVSFVLDGTGAFDERSHLATLSTIRQSYGQVITVELACRALEHERRTS